MVLQERDARVAALTAELESLPKQIAAVDDDLEARTAKFDELKNRTRQIEADRKKIDLDVQSKQLAISPAPSSSAGLKPGVSTKTTLLLRDSSTAVRNSGTEFSAVNPTPMMEAKLRNFSCAATR